MQLNTNTLEYYTHSLPIIYILLHHSRAQRTREQTTSTKIFITSALNNFLLYLVQYHPKITLHSHQPLTTALFSIPKMSALADLNSWQDAFIKFTVPEIRQLNDQLRDLSVSKKQELRDLVGNRYKDMLKTADIIISMNDLVTHEDEALSDLVTNESYTSWDSHESHFLNFNNSVIPTDGVVASTKNNTINHPYNTKNIQTNKTRHLYLQNQSISHLFSATLSFVKRHLNHTDIYVYEDNHPQNFLLIARSLWLVELLLAHRIQLFYSSNPIGGTPLSSTTASNIQHDVDQLKSTFDKILTRLLLNGEANDLLPSSSYNTLFLAYAHFHHLNPNSVLEKILSSRLSFIKTQFTNVLDSITSSSPSFQVSFLSDILILISSTFSIANKGFAKNSIPQLIQKQTEIYSLLDTPELADDIELRLAKHKPWLPDDIKSERAFPKECSTGIISTGRSSAKTVSYVRNQLQQFSNGVIQILSEMIPKFIDCIDNLDTLVHLYRQVLEVARDNSSIRNLSKKPLNDADGNSESTISFYQDIFVPAWSTKFNSIIETSINKLLSQENELSTIHSQILSDTSEPSLSSPSDFLFSVDFTSSLSTTRGYNYASLLFEALDDFSIGSIGLIKPVSHEYKEWLKNISEINVQLEEFGKLKGFLTLSYDADRDSDITDLFSILEDSNEIDEFGDDWRNKEKENISIIHSKSHEHINKTLVTVHDDVFRDIEKLFEINAENIPGAVLLIRAVLLFELYFQSMPKSSISRPLDSAVKSTTTPQILVQKIFSKLAGSLANELPKFDVSFYNVADSGLWSDAEKRWPDVPSLTTLKYLSTLIGNLTNVIGNDNLIWTNQEGISILQRTIGGKILIMLNGVYQNIQSDYESSIIKYKEQKDAITTPAEVSNSSNNNKSANDTKNNAENQIEEQKIEEESDEKKSTEVAATNKTEGEEESKEDTKTENDDRNESSDATIDTSKVSTNVNSSNKSQNQPPKSKSKSKPTSKKPKTNDDDDDVAQKTKEEVVDEQTPPIPIPVNNNNNNISDKEIEELQKKYQDSVLQLVADTYYISILLGIPIEDLESTSSSQSSLSSSSSLKTVISSLGNNNNIQDIFSKYKDNILKNIKDQVTKTRVLFLPFAV